MSQTNIEYFNSTLTLFIKDIIHIYPEYSDNLNDYYKDLLTSETSNDDKYIKRFIRNPFFSKKELRTAKSYLDFEFTASLVTVVFGRYDNESPPY